MKQNNNIRLKRELLLLSVILTGFIFIVSFASYYVKSLIDSGKLCGCVVPIPLMLILLASLGLFVGTFIAYLFYSKYLSEKRQVKNFETKCLLNLLDKDEKEIFDYLLKNDLVTQSKIAKDLKLTRVKVHRIVRRLSNKNIIEIIEEDNIKKVKLKDEFKRIFL